MATAHTAITRIEFIIEPLLTHCNIYYTSDEPGTPWGGGWKTKTFPATTPVQDILNSPEIPNYIMWSDGREGVGDNEN